MAVAFHGRSSSRIFGEATSGFATVNRGSRLSDGTNMVVTTGYYANRHGVQFPDVVQPDEAIDVGRTGWPFATDPASATAASWLLSQPRCVARPGG